jgi:hypothetical protein
MTNSRFNNGVAQFLDAFSLSGALILMLFALTVFGVLTKQTEVWRVFGSSLTSFVTAKKIAQYESSSKPKDPDPVDPPVEIKTNV